MLNHIVAKEKLERRFRDPIFGKGKSLKKRNYGPGVHGKKRKAKPSIYGGQLLQKQKLKFMYGLREKQFYNLYLKAVKSKNMTGTYLVQLLELRLDNVVYRLGIGNTRAAARQFVSHRHILVNDKIVNIPSYTLKPGDKISVKDKSKTLVKNVSEKSLYSWLDWDSNKFLGVVNEVPDRSLIEENIDENSVVNFYSR